MPHEGNSLECSRVITLSRYLGLAPKGTKIGDVVYIVQGEKVPFILRPTEQESFRFVGEAYIHGKLYEEMEEVAQTRDRMQNIVITAKCYV